MVGDHLLHCLIIIIIKIACISQRKSITQVERGTFSTAMHLMTTTNAMLITRTKYILGKNRGNGSELVAKSCQRAVSAS